jgi:predicted ATPase
MFSLDTTRTNHYTEHTSTVQKDLIPMLTDLRFKNWRSLRDVEINDLTPITVFIGPNSSGKTNILDALRFRRDSLQKGLVNVVRELGYRKIQTNAFENNQDVELIFTHKLHLSNQPITEEMILQFDKRDMPFKFGRRLYEGDSLLLDDPLRELPVRDDLIETRIIGSGYQKASRFLTELYELIMKRWQILGDNFAPHLNLPRNEGGDVYLIEPDARNTLLILNFMQQVRPDLYNQLQEDLHSILNHVTGMEIWLPSQNRELELLIREGEGQKRAPTVSMGTMRLIAMLTAIYALDMSQEMPASFAAQPKVLTPDMPGLVVIEEPDTALNPQLLNRFVGQLRNYVEGEHPRQFILTTHNPALLNYFEPEEVRVVERNEQGYTTVNRIPEHVREIWLDEYGLGEVWTTNSFGGLAE